MINWLTNFFKNDEQVQDIVTPEDTQVNFFLTYKDLLIGTLTLNNGYWYFEYSVHFKNQNKVDVIVDFPIKDKVYESKHLWPFFAHRIPGLGQPQVQKIIHKENLNPKNEVDLLRRFGSRSISNPFSLAVS